MSRFRNRHDHVAEPAPGTILPGVPLVGRDVGRLIPQQRVHDPLSSADRSEVLLEQVTIDQDAPVEELPLEEFTLKDQSVEQLPVDELPVDQEAADDDELMEHVVEALEIEEVDASQAIDDELLDAVVRRRPRATQLSAGAMVRPPAPERLKLMVGVLARDFERFGSTSVQPPPAPGTRVDDADVTPVWGPWPKPHTAAWPVVVPSWGELPRSFGAPIPDSLTRSA